MIPTANQMGVMRTQHTPATLEWLEYSKDKLVMDIGCAYGAATKAALSNGASVIAIDMCQEHLNVLESDINEEYKDNLRTVHAVMPNISANAYDYIDGILLSNVLHFMHGNDVLRTLTLCYNWLDSKGKIFISVATPYMNIVPEYLVDEYYRRFNEGLKWPGVCYLHELGIHSDEIPDLVHVFTVPVLENAIEQCGFDVERCWYSGDDKGQLNAIAKKVI